MAELHPSKGQDLESQVCQLQAQWQACAKTSERPPDLSTFFVPPEPDAETALKLIRVDYSERHKLELDCSWAHYQEAIGPIPPDSELASWLIEQEHDCMLEQGYEKPIDELKNRIDSSYWPAIGALADRIETRSISFSDSIESLASKVRKQHIQATTLPAPIHASDVSPPMPGHKVLDALANNTVERIGSYRPIRKIGSGGMGEVWLAENTKLRGMVALKLLKNMGGREQLGLALAEARASFAIDHPNVIKVLEAGEIPGGPGYIIQQLCHDHDKSKEDDIDLGKPLDKLNKAEPLAPQEAARITAAVCRGVAAAHNKGRVHRDIKPANILLTPKSRRPMLLDFGLASNKPAPATMAAEAGDPQPDHTLEGGTLEYAPLEQIAGEPSTPAMDIWALGATLYELLCGQTPYRSRGKYNRKYPGNKYQAKAHDIGEQIAQGPPPKPCTIRPGVPPILEQICLKALSAAPDDRYVSPDAMASDLDAWLSHRPTSFETSHSRHARLWYRRNRVWASVAACLVLLLGVASIVYMQSIKAEQRRTLAERDLKEEQRLLAVEAEKQETKERIRADEAAARANEQADIAQQRAEDLEQVVQFQASQLSEIDPTLMGLRLRKDLLAEARTRLESEGVAPGQIDEQMVVFESLLSLTNPTNVALRSLEQNIFNRALMAIDTQFDDQPLVKAQLLQTLANTLQKIGLLQQAMPPQAEALEIHLELRGREHPETLISINNMGTLIRAQGLLDESMPYYQEAIDTQRRVLGDEHPQTLASISNMGILLMDQGRLDEAMLYCQESLDTQRRVLGDEHPDTLNSISNMGILLINQGRLDEAMPYYQEAIDARRRVLGDEHPDTLDSIGNMGVQLIKQGLLDEAMPYCLEALDTQRRVLGDEHPKTLTSINNMGVLLINQGRLDEAMLYCQEVLDTQRRVLGDEHPDTLSSINNMGALLLGQGRFDEAIPYFQESLDIQRRVLGDEHPDTLGSINNIGTLLRAQGLLDKAMPYYQEALDARRRVLGDEHPETLVSINNMGVLLADQGQLDEAMPYFLEALDTHRHVLGDAHPDTLDSISNMGVLLDTQGRFEEALPYHQEALDTRRRVLGDAHPDVLASANNLVHLYSSWHLVEPDAGYDRERDRWQRTLEELQAIQPQ